MTCFLLFGTSIPQSKVVLDTDKSFNPPETKLITSFFLLSGCMKFGLFL